SIVATFILIKFAELSLNVISLGGLALGIGMLVDNSVVVTENIARHLAIGKSPRRAAIEGTSEVSLAIVVSTLTTLAVFVPVIFIEEEAGQLFRDIAIAISAAVLLSLVISVLFIPMAAARLVRGTRKPVEVQEGSSAASLASGIAGFVAWLNQSVMRRLLTVVGLTGAAVGLSWLILPPMAYLPSGNQNLVIGFVIPPPGYNLDEFEEIAKQVEARLEPYWGVREGKELGPEERWPPWFQGEGELPGLENFFYVASGNNVFMGARSMDATNVKPLAQLMMHAVAEIPGLMVFAFQTSLFQRGISAGNAIDLEVSGFDMRQIKRSALALMGRIMQSYGFPRPEPANFHLAAPELRVRLDESRASELGLSARDVGFLVQSLIDGAIVSDYREGGVTLDVKLLPGERADSSDEQIRQVPVYTPSGRQVPLSLVAAFEPTTASNEIRHIEEKRAVRLIVTPPEGVELSVVMEDLGRNIIPALREGGAIPPGVTTTLAGTAAKLTSTREALELNFVLAIVITYLLLSALFESFFFPVVILFSVPLAAAGGILGLRIVHSVTGQQMDVLTMLGFVILIGTVVNNAILIVHQAINLIREGSLGDAEAIVESVRTRVRPIFMSTSTSVLGMTPLVLFPGAGSELYKGLGSVVIGGLVASTLFTLLVVPTLFSMTLRVWRLLQRGASPS
ncbi:MAG: efflux RND transporter permease subunit, partial [Planctomycetota bacterium]